MIAFVRAIGLMVDTPSAPAAIAVLKNQLVMDMSASAYIRGVREGMRGWEARLVAGELVLINCDPETCEEAQRKFRTACMEVSPGVKELGYGRALIDVGRSGLSCEALHPFTKVAQIVFIGVGINELVARIAAQLLEKECSNSKRTGLSLKTVPPERTLEFLDRIPVTSLWPLDGATIEKLLKLGFHRIGEIRAVPPETLMAVFGKNGLRIWEMANGNFGITSIPPLPSNPRFLKRFDREVDNLQDLCFALQEIASRANDQLRRIGCSYSSITLSLVLSSGRCISRTRRFRVAKEPGSVGLILRLMAEDLKLPCGVTEVSVEISGLSMLDPVQLTLEQPATEKRCSLEGAMRIRGVLTANQLVSRRERMLCYWDPLRGLMAR